MLGVSSLGVGLAEAAAAADGLHFAPERVEAQLVWMLCLGAPIRSGLIVMVHPGIHAHLGGAGVPGRRRQARREGGG